MPDRNDPQVVQDYVAPDPRLPAQGLTELNRLLVRAGEERDRMDEIAYLRQIERVLETEFTLRQLHWLLDDVFVQEYVARETFLQEKERTWTRHPAGGVYIFYDERGAWRYDWIDPILLFNHSEPKMMVAHVASHVLTPHLYGLSYPDGNPYLPGADPTTHQWLHFKLANPLLDK